MSGPLQAEEFLSGASGQVSGIRATTRAVLADALLDARALLSLQRPRLRRAARSLPPRRVLALSVTRNDAATLITDARTELERSQHEVSFAATDAGNQGKFENLNVLLAEHPAEGADWLLVVDDDVALPRGFLDSFIFLAEQFDLRLAQPAHRRRSHAAWEVTRRRAGSVVRETAFVEIGPVFALHSSTFGRLLPFPPLRAGWGLDSHWSAIAQQQGWRLGVVDATPVLHGARRIADAYDRGAALEESRQFLATRSHISSAQAQQTLATHRSWR